MQIFNYVGYIFGYILWFCYNFTVNYGISIILFTLIIKIITVPFSIKQQKSMAQTARLSGKQQELKEKYGTDRQKLQEETAKLYEKEGVNMFGSCSTMLVPLLIMFGVYYAVLNPLTNTLHIDAESVKQATNLLSQIPGVGTSFTGLYKEIQIVQNFDFLKNYLGNIFNSYDINNISMFNQGFNFLGINLLGTPKGSSFNEYLWVIPVLSFLSALGSQVFTQKITGSNNQQAQQGCMKGVMYLMPLFSAWITYTVPAAVGFYWITSNVLTFAQTALLNTRYNATLITVKEEAARIALKNIEEKKVRKVYIQNTEKQKKQKK